MAYKSYPNPKYKKPKSNPIHEALVRRMKGKKGKEIKAVNA